MQEGRKIQDTQGLDAYIKYMVDNEDKPLAPGPAFGFVQALENVNLQLLKINEEEKNLFDVVLARDYFHIFYNPLGAQILQWITLKSILIP